jgi:hypothetical protein
MKRILFLVLLCNSTLLFSQEAKKRLTLSVAPAFPLGKWAEKEQPIENAGYASSGQSFHLRYTNDFSANWGWFAMLKGQRNQLNADNLSDYHNNNPFPVGGLLVGPGPGPGPLPPAEVDIENWSFKKKNWMTATAMGGFYRIIPGGKRSVFLPELGLGLIYAKLPDFLGTAQDGNRRASLTRKGKHGVGLAYSVGLNARHRLNAKYDIFSSLAYFGSSSVKFNDISTTRFYTDGTTVAQTVRTMDHQQVFASMNLYIGVGIKL